MEKPWDLSVFELIEVTPDPHNGCALTITAEGILRLNGKMREKKEGKDLYVTLRLHPQGDLLVLEQVGEDTQHARRVSKAGIIKLPELCPIFKEKKIPLPAYFWAEWDEKRSLWMCTWYRDYRFTKPNPESLRAKHPRTTGLEKMLPKRAGK